MQYRLLIQFELEDKTDTLEALLWENAVSVHVSGFFVVVVQNRMRFQHLIKGVQVLLFVKATYKKMKIKFLHHTSAEGAVFYSEIGLSNHLILYRRSSSMFLQ